MVSEIVVPENDVRYAGPGHWVISYGFIRRYAKLAGAKVMYLAHGKHPNVWSKIGLPHASILVDGKQFILDISDKLKDSGVISNPRASNSHSLYPNIVCGRYLYFDPECRKYENMYPLGVMIGATPHPKDPDRVDELKEYFDLVDRNLYNPHNSNRIISNQKAHSNALKRRGDVQQFLKERYGDLVDTRYNLRQSDLWKGVSDCLVAVAVPGATVNCTDRWHIQLFGLGVCMITAVLGVCFTWFKKPQPWIHYVPCKPNFEDLGDRIEWCRNNRDKCLEIGNNAATLFQECYSLESYWGWVEYILNQHY